MESVADVTATLQQHPDVLGLVEYGSDHRIDNYRTGDLDLYVVLRTEPPIDSLHFYVAGVPVDLGLITLDAIRALRGIDSFEAAALATGRIRYDPSSAVAHELAQLRQRRQTSTGIELSAHDIAFVRFGQKHVLDKVQGRLETMPLFCRFLLHTNTYWLVQNYFLIRSIPYQGETWAIDYLQMHEPEIAHHMANFYANPNLAEQVAISRTLTAAILAPVGGAWQDDEVLAFGENAGKDLPQQGLAMFNNLFARRASSQHWSR